MDDFEVEVELMAVRSLCFSQQVFAKPDSLNLA